MVSPSINSDTFFDRDAVIRAVSSGERRALSRIGAAVMTRARWSLKKRKKSSPPGQPPSRHASTHFSLAFILFNYESREHQVVIGPVKFTNSEQVPHLMEFGGTKTLKRSRGRSATARYAPRPFMGPAAELIAKQMPSIIAREM